MIGAYEKPTKLEELQFIVRATSDTFVVLDTGKDWSKI